MPYDLMGGDVDRKLDLYAPITFKATENQPTEAILILILRAAKFMRLDCGEESQRGVVRQAAIFIGGVVEFVPVEPEAREQLIDLRNAKLIDCPRFWAFFTVQPSRTAIFPSDSFVVASLAFEARNTSFTVQFTELP